LATFIATTAPARRPSASITIGTYRADRRPIFCRAALPALRTNGRLQDRDHAFHNIIYRRHWRKSDDLLRIVAPHSVRLFSLARNPESAVILLNIPKQHAALERGPGTDTGIFQQYGRRYLATPQYRDDWIAARDRCAQCLPDFF